MAHTKAIWTLFGTLLVWGVLSCTDAEPCEKRAKTQSCTCSGGAPGEQVCLPELVWGECKCQDAADAGDEGGHGGSGGAKGGSGAGGSAGSGGSGGSGGGKGGSGGAAGAGAGGTAAAGDGGSTPSGDAGPDGGPLGGSGGSGGSGGDGGGGGGGAADPYRTCNMDTDCGAGSSCVTLSVGFPLPMDVLGCSPDCTTPASCPKPAGGYEAELACVSGGCRLECTAPDLLSPMLSCPTGFSCQDEPSGSAYCLH